MFSFTVPFSWSFIVNAWHLSQSNRGSHLKILPQSWKSQAMRTLKEHLSPLLVVCIWFGMTNRAWNRTRGSSLLPDAESTALQARCSNRVERGRERKRRDHSWELGSGACWLFSWWKQRSPPIQACYIRTPTPPHPQAPSDQTQQQWTRIWMRDEHVSFMPAQKLDSS